MACRWSCPAPGLRCSWVRPSCLLERCCSDSTRPGRSGSGKTTLLSLLAGLCEPSKGSVCVGDAAEHTPAPLRAQRVGCVFQFPERHFLGETLAQELTFGWPRAETAGARCATLSPSRVFHASHAPAPSLSATRAADAQRVLRACGLAQLALDAPLRSLSGGQQRRLALAVQLLRRPPLLLLDEPLAGLDWRARVALLPLLCAVARSCCVLAVTHDTQLLKPRATAGRWRMHAGGLQREEDACADC